MITWVLYLCIGIVIGGMAGFYFAKLDDFSKKQKRELEEKLQRSEQELIDYKDQVTTHFKETAALVNNMTESYQKVHEHLARGSVELCNNAIEVNKLEVSPNQLLTDSAEEIPARDVNPDAGADVEAAVKAETDDADNVLTEKAESEAPKTQNNKKNKQEVEIPVSAARAAIDQVADDDLETGTDTVTVPETSVSESRPSPKVATSPDSTSNPTATNSSELPPHVTETMAVAEELDETVSESSAESEKAGIPGSRMVH